MKTGSQLPDFRFLNPWLPSADGGQFCGALPKRRYALSAPALI
jgi:hypothetical protein